jgi:tetratricopeptide (TPR) repeat protein
MRAVRERFPEDANVAALTAEALMDLHPWDFWREDGAARPWTGEIAAMLEDALALDPEHTGAIHLYIHAVEQSQDPERAEPFADRLADLAPEAGHLVHMPAHIYMRVGRYHDSTLNNMRATDADAAFVAVCRSDSPIYLAGYIPHNWHFGWVTAAIEGWREQAFAMADGTAAQLSPELLRAPGMAVAQHFLAQPIFARVRFAAWDELLAAEAPAEDLPYARALWHWGRGLALAATGDPAGARAEHEALEAIRSDPTLAELAFFGQSGRGARVLAIAERSLAGDIAVAEGDLAGAVPILEEGVALEDVLPYNEPPDWYPPVRHALGAVQLELGRAADAEATYRADLEAMRENGWALAGLERALRDQGRDAEADAVAERFARAWQHADVQIRGSRVEAVAAR